MKISGPKARVDAARSAETTAEDLAVLSTASEIFVREEVAKNNNTPPNVLASLVPKRLAEIDDWRILFALVTNTNTPRYIMDVIEKKLLPEIGKIAPRDYYPNLAVQALAESSTIPISSLRMLADPEVTSKYLRKKLARHGVRKELLEILVSDSSTKVSAKARAVLDDLKSSSNNTMNRST